jgi:polyphosphate kinase
MVQYWTVSSLEHSVFGLQPQEANIGLSAVMAKAGVKVTYGIPELKTHAKMALIVRHEEQGLRSYAHFGTGVYSFM